MNRKISKGFNSKRKRYNLKGGGGHPIPKDFQKNAKPGRASWQDTHRERREPFVRLEVGKRYSFRYTHEWAVEGPEHYLGTFYNTLIYVGTLKKFINSPPGTANPEDQADPLFIETWVIDRTTGVAEELERTTRSDMPRPNLVGDFLARRTDMREVREVCGYEAFPDTYAMGYASGREDEPRMNWLDATKRCLETEGCRAVTCEQDGLKYACTMRGSSDLHAHPPGGMHREITYLPDDRCGSEEQRRERIAMTPGRAGNLHETRAQQMLRLQGGSVQHYQLISMLGHEAY